MEATKDMIISEFIPMEPRIVLVLISGNVMKKAAEPSWWKRLLLILYLR